MVVVKWFLVQNSGEFKITKFELVWSNYFKITT